MLAELLPHGPGLDHSQVEERLGLLLVQLGQQGLVLLQDGAFGDVPRVGVRVHHGGQQCQARHLLGAARHQLADQQAADRGAEHGQGLLAHQVRDDVVEPVRELRQASLAVEGGGPPEAGQVHVDPLPAAGGLERVVEGEQEAVVHAQAVDEQQGAAGAAADDVGGRL